MCICYDRAEDVTYLEEELLADLTGRLDLGRAGGGEARVGVIEQQQAQQKADEEEEECGSEMEVKSQEEACRLLRVLSEDMGMRADIEALRKEAREQEELLYAQYIKEVCQS